MIKTLIIIISTLISFAYHGVANEYWEGAKLTSKILSESRSGPVTIMETDLSLITVCSGIIQTANWSQPHGPVGSFISERPILPLANETGSDAAAQLASFAFSHMDKATYKQKWLFSSGWFRDASVKPYTWQRRLCGMTHDETRLWLLFWEGNKYTKTNGHFQVLAFEASTGALEYNFSCPDSTTNQHMNGFREYMQRPGGHGDTYDYLGDLAIKIIEGKLIVFGKEYEMKSLEQSVPAYPPQGVGSAEP